MWTQPLAEAFTEGISKLYKLPYSSKDSMTGVGEYRKFTSVFIETAFYSLIKYKNITEASWKRSLKSIFDYLKQSKEKLTFSKGFISDIINSGNFGQQVLNRRFSAFFARKLVRCATSSNCEIYDLADRIFRLANDSEKDVRLEVSKAFKEVYLLSLETEQSKVKLNEKKLKRRYTLFNADRVCFIFYNLGKGKGN